MKAYKQPDQTKIVMRPAVRIVKAQRKEVEHIPQLPSMKPSGREGSCLLAGCNCSSEVSPAAHKASICSSYDLATGSQP